MTEPAELATPVQRLDFDPNRLHDYLRRELPWLGDDFAITAAGGGQSNPTYFASSGGSELVVRKRPAGVGAGPAHDVVREHRLISALADSQVPVPRPRLVCTDDAVIGAPFYVMERANGRIFHHAALDSVPPADRPAYYLAHARSLATLHNLDWREVGLGDLARPGSFLERQIRRWTQAWDDERAAEGTHLREWLIRRQPRTESQALIHGDYKFNNLVFDESEPKLVAVLDWELAAIGDPLLDLAHCWCAMWATTPDEYGGVLGLDLARLGLPQAETYIDAYGEAAGTEQGLPVFYRVLALIRNAGIFLGIGQRARAGTAAAANAAEQGRLALVYLERAIALTSPGAN